jgi:hypothetical protein
MPIISTVVTWKGASFSLKLDTASPVEEFRLQVQALTGVPCARQKIMGFPGGLLKASSWDDIVIKGDKICVMMSGESEAAAAAAAPSVEAATPEVSRPSPPINDVCIASSSSDAMLINVTVKTTQSTIMCLRSIPADSVIGRIKVLLSQPPHNCGQPVAMKLIYKGEPATIPPQESAPALFYQRSISACDFKPFFLFRMTTLVLTSFTQAAS